MVCGWSTTSSGGVWIKNVLHREVFQNHLEYENSDQVALTFEWNKQNGIDRTTITRLSNSQFSS